MQINGIHNISFGAKSFKFRQIDNLNRELCAEISGIPSSTRMYLKFDTVYKNYDSCPPKQSSFIKKSNEIMDRIWKLRDEFDKQYTLNQDYDYKLLQKLVRKYRGANCREMVELMKYKLTAKSIDCRLIGMDIKTKNPALRRMASDHVFLVANMSKEAKASEPATWGSKAIIIDPWGQTVSYAADGLNHLKNLFKLDEAQEYMIFTQQV